MPHPKLYPYEKTFAELHETLIPYYRSWVHDRPMVLSRERDRELAELALQRRLALGGVGKSVGDLLENIASLLEELSRVRLESDMKEQLLLQKSQTISSLERDVAFYREEVVDQVKLSR